MKVRISFVIEVDESAVDGMSDMDNEVYYAVKELAEKLRFPDADDSVFPKWEVLE